MVHVMRLSTTVVLHGLCFVIDLDLISLALFAKLIFSCKLKRLKSKLIASDC